MQSTLTWPTQHFDSPYTVRAHDTRLSCRPGDTVALRSHWRVAPRVRHVVTRIEQPFGSPASARPPVPAADELVDIFAERLRGRIADEKVKEEEGRGKIAEVKAKGRGRGFGGVKGGARKVMEALEEVELARERGKALAEELARLEVARAEAPAGEAALEQAAAGGAAEVEGNPWKRQAREAARAWEAESQRRSRTRSSRAPPQRRAAGEDTA
jgi:hypothetical protein